MRRLRSVNKKRRASFHSRFRSKLLYEVGVDGVARIYSVFDNLNLSDADAFLVWVDSFLVSREGFIKQGIKSGTYFRYVVSRKKHVKIQVIEKPYQAKGRRNVLETPESSRTR